jgi:hypothetical protein
MRTEHSMYELKARTLQSKDAEGLGWAGMQVSPLRCAPVEMTTLNVEERVFGDFLAAFRIPRAGVAI